MHYLIALSLHVDAYIQYLIHRNMACTAKNTESLIVVWISIESGGDAQIRTPEIRGEDTDGGGAGGAGRAGEKLELHGQSMQRTIVSIFVWEDFKHRCQGHLFCSTSFIGENHMLAYFPYT